MLKFNYVWCLIIFILIQGCDTNKPIDRDAINEELKSREIMRITESQFTAKGLEIGNQITDKAQRVFQQNLLTAIEQDGVLKAIEFCNLNASKLIKELEDSTGLLIYRTSEKIRNPENIPDSLELLLLEAYAYSDENGLELKPSIIQENEQVLLYSRPIRITTGLCLSCHGKERKEVSRETRKTLSELYPSDEATGYSLNDFRGMWSIRISKKVIANSL